MLKEKLLQFCHQYITTRLESIHTAIQDARVSTEAETKSTAGDKHETGRAMIQLELESLARQLDECKKVKSELESISIGHSSGVVKTGSLVKTVHGNFFVSISAGKMEIEGEVYHTLAINTPLGALLKGKRQGDSFTLNGRSYVVEEVL